MDSDRNLLFGVLALQADLLDPVRFAEACTAWSARKDTALAELLVEREWLTPDERADVEKLLARKLQKHKGDVRAGLAEVTTEGIRRSLSGLADAAIQESLVGLTTPPGPAEPGATTVYQPEARNRYTLSRLHASGGIGRVWLARDASLGRDVALKELRPEQANKPAVVGRFLREAQLTGQLEHPGIVPIYELGQRPEDQQPFYTMRFLRGRTLAEAAAAYHQGRTRGAAGPLELRELLTAFTGVCNAVAYAHSRGVLHRDLKPHNVVLGGFGEVLVVDWGLARVMGEPEDDAPPVELPANGTDSGTIQGQVLGTPAYMAPEQAEGRLDQLGPASDVHGLGAILFEILTGRPPFKGKDPTAVLRQVIHEPPPRPGSLEKGVPRALEAICEKALAKKPSDRYGSASELANEVQRWLADEPVRAYREPLTVRAGRWMKRHRTFVTSALAAGLVALVGLAVILTVQSRSNRELSAANHLLQDANERERQRFDLALEAISAFRTGVTDDALLKDDQFKGVRTKLLGGAAGFYRKLEKLMQGQEDARSRQALGKAYFELGQLEFGIGTFDQAEAAQERARAIRQQLAEADPANLAWQSDLAQSHEAVAQLASRRARFADALAEMQEALAIRLKLVDAEPANIDFLSELAKTQSFVGALLSFVNKRTEGWAEYQRALEIRQKLVAAEPNVAQFQSDLAQSQQVLAGLQASHTGEYAEALSAYRKARATWEKLVHDHPANPDFQLSLANNHTLTGGLLSRTLGEPEKALVELRACQVLQQKVAVANPAVISYQAALAQTTNNIGYLLASTLGKPKEALEEFQNCAGAPSEAGGS